MKIALLNVILITVLCLISGCKKEVKPHNDPCEDILNEGPPRKIGLVFVDKDTRNNLILASAFHANDIKVTLGETGKPSNDWRIITGPVNSPLNGFLEFSFFNETPGDHIFKIEIKGFETVTLSYTILQEKTDNPCRPYSYPMEGLKILNQNWDLFKYEGRIYVGILEVRL